MPTNNYDNIPAEMREYKSWCLWKKVVKPDGSLTKIPFQANGEPAKSNDPATWITFEQAVACAPAYDGIGFVLSLNDPYAFIDLDDKHNNNPPDVTARQMKILKEFDSYSERSPSRTGCHIIVKGSVPKGCNREKIEIYSNERFMTMTGDTWAIRPIVDRNDLLNQLYFQIVGQSSHENLSADIPEGTETQTDDEIIELAFKYNSEKFVLLSLGEWQGRYPSQSEADQAYMNIISAYTRSKQQTIRIYSRSKLAETDAKRKSKAYLTRTVNKAFDQKVPDVQFNGYDAISASVAQRSEPTPHKSLDTGSNPVASTIVLPPGLTGEIAQFIYSSAPKPVHEIAIAGALGLMAGICGKAYNISKTGLNHYILCLAPTGTGKEAMASGISKLISAARLQVPVAGEFIGPSAIASSQGLHKWLSKNSQCFVSILGEFGLKLEAMSLAKANANQIQLKDSLLALFNKSGKTDEYGGSAYADQEKNTAVIRAPAFSILGESTPDTFYTVLTEQMIKEGLLPRFSIIEYKGIRVKTNSSPQEPSSDLINKLCLLMAHAKTQMATQKVIDVVMDLEATQISNEIDELCDSKVNASNDINSELWSRAYIKMLKLSALIAVGINPFQPTVTKESINWAWGIVQHDIAALSSKFEQGLVGKSNSELKQADEMTRIIKEYLNKDFEHASKYGAHSKLHENKIISNTYLNNRLGKLAVFQNDRAGANSALKRCVQLFVDDGKLISMGGPDFMQKFNTTQKCWKIRLD